MQEKKKYIILNDGKTKFSDVVNDCETYCFPTQKGESLTSVIKRLCTYINDRISLIPPNLIGSATIQTDNGQISLRLFGNGPVTVGDDGYNVAVISTDEYGRVSSAIERALFPSNITAGRVFASDPSSASGPSFRALQSSDIPFAYVQGGNSFGALAVLGTNDNNFLVLRTNGSNHIKLDDLGTIGSVTDTWSFDLTGRGNMNFLSIDNLPSLPTGGRYIVQNTLDNEISYRTNAQVVSDLGVIPLSRQLTINGYTYDLSADRTWTLTTSDIAEGTNLYFTNERVDDRVAVLIQNGTGISWSYNDLAGTLTPTITLSPFTTSDLSEGSNLYYTDARVLAYGDTQWVQLDGSYSNPSWITSLAWSKITGTPTTLSGYGITDVYTQTQINNFFSGTTAITGYNKANWDAAYAAVGTYVLKTGDTMTGSLLLGAAATLDSVLTGGTDTLNIGTTNADVINIGWSGSTININGTLLWQNVTNLSVTDKLIRLNVGGAVSSGSSSGFEIEENGVATGYFATDGTRTGWDFKAPASQQLSLALDLLTTTRTIKPPNGDGIIILDTLSQTITGLKTFSLAGSWSGLLPGTVNLASTDNNISFFETAGSGYAHVGMNDTAGWFGMQSAFSNVRIKGGANDSNKREVALYTGDTLGFYIDVNANSFVQNQLNIGTVASATSASLFLTMDGTIVKSRTTAQVLSDIGAQAALNGTGFVKISGTTISYDNSTYLTGNQTITLSGHVTGSGATSITTTIGAGVVTNAMLAGSIDLTTKVTNVLPVANGGTGLSTVPSTRIPFGNGTSALGTTASLTWDGTFLSASNFITAGGGRIYFGGGSGGSNDIRWDTVSRFIIKSDFDVVTIQGGINDSNKRQIDFWTGLTESAYIDINGVFWKSASSTAISNSDNSLKFATTAFVQNNLANYLPLTGGTLTANGAPLVINSANSNIGKLTFQDNTTIRSTIGASSSYAFHVQDSSGNVRMTLGITNGRLGLGTSGVSAPISLLANTGTNLVGSDNQGMNNNSLTFAMSENGYVAGFYNGQDSSISNGLAVKIRNSSAVALDVSRDSSQSTQGTMLFQVLGNGRIRTSNPGGNANTVRFGGYLSQSGSSNTVSGFSGTQFIWHIELDGTNLYIPVWSSIQ